MRAYLIDPITRSITEETIADAASDISRLIGFDSIDSDEIDDNGDRLFFDESCFIRHGSEMPRFKVDNLAPVAGKGVVAGGPPGSKGLSDALISVDELRSRVTFL